MLAWHPQPVRVTPKVDAQFRFLFEQAKGDEEILKLNAKVRQAAYNQIRERLGQDRQHGTLNMTERLLLCPQIDREMEPIYRDYSRNLHQVDAYNNAILDACVAVLRFMERHTLKYWVSEYPPELGDGPALHAAMLLYQELERMGHLTRR